MAGESLRMPDSASPGVALFIYASAVRLQCDLAHTSADDDVACTASPHSGADETSLPPSRPPVERPCMTFHEEIG